MSTMLKSFHQLLRRYNRIPNGYILSAAYIYPSKVHVSWIISLLWYAGRSAMLEHCDAIAAGDEKYSVVGLESYFHFV